jgi:uncharacterized protein
VTEILDPTRQPTFTGKRIDPFHMSPDDVCIEDIAHHLSQVNRYNGATEYPYSVGQHSLLVADILLLGGASPRVELAGMLHDGSEAYINDVTTPVKYNAMSEAYRELEWGLQRLIEAVFDLPYGLTEADIVKWADKSATEREWVWFIERSAAKCPPGLAKMAPEHVEAAFLSRIQVLDAQIRQLDPSHPASA